MAELQVEQPKSLIRASSWTTEVENAYRFQLAGYRDEKEYRALRKSDVIDLIEENNSIYLLFNYMYQNLRSKNGQRPDLLKSFKDEKMDIFTITTERENVLKKT